MAKGAEAKQKVEKIISEAFGDKFLGVEDKKIYVQAKENGEMITVAIALTVPKNVPNFASAEKVKDFDWSESASTPTEEDQRKVDELMAKLDLL